MRREQDVPHEEQNRPGKPMLKNEERLWMYLTVTDGIHTDRQYAKATHPSSIKPRSCYPASLLICFYLRCPLRWLAAMQLAWIMRAKGNRREGREGGRWGE